MRAERRPAGSTGGTALVYAAPMRSTSIIVPALLLLVTDSIRCKDETPANTPGEFGDPCVPGANDDTPDGCVAGTECYKGYCEEICIEDQDCQPVEGWKHSCELGLCQIWCDDAKECPQTLGVPMTCELTSTWCKADGS